MEFISNEILDITLESKDDYEDMIIEDVELTDEELALLESEAEEQEDVTNADDEASDDTAEDENTSVDTKTEKATVSDNGIDMLFTFESDVNENKASKLEDKIEDLDDSYEDAKKKLTQGFYTQNQFDDITDAHEKKVKELKEKIKALK